jgi:hypothetical protein
MNARPFLLSMCPLLFSAALHAADKPCSAADAANAEKTIDRVVGWAQYHKAYVDYKHCDSKQSVADVYTDALLRLTVDWKNVGAFADVMNKDAGFKDFVRAHLQSPAAKDDADAVYSRTKTMCPKGLEAFCTELGGFVRTAGPAAPATDAMQPVPMMKPMQTAPAEAATPAAKK